jgi:ribosomal protein S18 acetylase RimI-like enzyme
MEPTAKVRAFVPGEEEAVLRLWRRGATTSSTDTPADIARVVGREGARFMIAEVDGEIVGTLISTFDGWRGNVYRLVVDPAHRRRGVARALVADAERAFARWGARRITALVEHEHDWATGFWAAVGYALDVRMARFVRTLPPAGAAR